MTYKVKTGHNQPADDLVAIAPQPSSPGIQCTRRSYAGDGTPICEGPWTPLSWNITSKAQFDAILTAFGLASAGSSLVTVLVRDQEFDFVRKNGLAIKPVPGDGVE